MAGQFMSTGREPEKPSTEDTRPTVFVSTGCTSADVVLAPVLAELRRRGRIGEAVGMGGTSLRDLGVRLFLETTPLASVGLFASLRVVLRHGARLLPAYRCVKRYFREARPDLVILVDNPGLNLWLLALARRLQIPVLYYVPPEVWSLTRWQLRGIARQATAIASILPAESEAYQSWGGDVRPVGHPCVDLLRTVPRPPPLDERRPLVALFPGSRGHEVKDLMPVLRGAVEIIHRSEPKVRFVLCAANAVAAQLICEQLPTWTVPVELVHQQSHAVLSRSDLLLTCSGTATLEAAILGVPMVVMYRLYHWADRVIQRCGFRLASYPFFSLPNYLLKRGVVPELRNRDLNPQRVADEALALLRDPDRRRTMCAGLAEVCEHLGPPGAVERVADLVEEMLFPPQRLEDHVRHERMVVTHV
jgi:lipid-A-disaccharide synthase